MLMPKINDQVGGVSMPTVPAPSGSIPPTSTIWREKNKADLLRWHIAGSSLRRCVLLMTDPDYNQGL